MSYVWDKSLETGNQIIDGQHRSLINAINDLLDACNQGKGRAEVEKTLEFLNNYVINHFNDEEKLQIKYKYPQYIEHKAIHETFKKEVSEIAKEYKTNGATVLLVSKVNKSIGDWLIKHIKNVDKKLAEHISKSQV